MEQRNQMLKEMQLNKRETSGVVSCSNPIFYLKKPSSPSNAPNQQLLQSNRIKAYRSCLYFFSVSLIFPLMSKDAMDEVSLGLLQRSGNFIKMIKNRY